MRAAFYTLGCKLNQSESEALASAFRSQGFSIVGYEDQADIYIVNTCTVTSKAEQKARRMIRRFSRLWPDGMVIITGCYVQLDAHLLQDLGPHVYLVSQEKKDRLMELPEYLASLSLPDTALPLSLGNFFHEIEQDDRIEDPFAFNVSLFQYHSRAFLKIQDGCDNRCAYCRVTLARGDARSLPVSRVLERISVLEAEGYREIVLTGVNITSYRDGETDFPALLSLIFNHIKTARIRLSSLEPETITPELGRVLAHPAVCPHFHIPVQSGSDAVLGRMRRKNNREKITRGVEILRSAVKNPFLAADIIVGFPGETEADFQDSVELLTRLNFSELHVFPFSARPGTEAFSLANPVPERITGERTRLLRELSRTLHNRYLQGCEGNVYSFLLEQDVPEEDSGTDSHKEGSGTRSPEERIWRGVSENYLKMPVRILKENPEKGGLCRARVERTSPGGFFARETE